MTSTAIDRLAGLSSSEALKIPVTTVTTAAITLSGTQTVNGVALVAGDDVLVNNQADQTTNGIYTVSTQAWTRRPDFDGPLDAVPGTIVFVNSDNAGLGPRFWQLSVSDNPVVIGTTHITFAVVSLETDAAIAAAQSYADQAAASVAEASTLTSSIFSGTSATSIAVSTGSRSFVTQAGKAFSGFVVIYSSANHANYMHGTVTSYSGTALTVNVLDIGGSGTHTDWIIAISAPQGPTGAMGASGSGSGDMVSTNNLSDLTDASAARSNIGLGSAATLNVGTTANKVVQLDGSAKLPAVDGSQLINVPNVITPGAVSSYCFCVRVGFGVGIVGFGSTIAGSYLSPSSCDSSGDGSTFLSGTWQGVSYTHGTSSGGTSLFQRIL